MAKKILQYMLPLFHEGVAQFTWVGIFLVISFLGVSKFEAQVSVRSKYALDVKFNTSAIFRINPALRSKTPFFTFAMSGQGAFQWEDIEIRTFAHGKWAAWTKMNKARHKKPDEDDLFSSLMFFDVSVTQLAIRLGGNAKQVVGYIDLLSPSDARSSAMKDIRIRTDCDTPLILTRDLWCPDGSCEWGVERVKNQVTHFIVHHSAGPNFSTNWDAVVRSIWHYHVVTRGWDDIGYNWLISPEGVLYEGRGKGILGAHYCAQNTNTSGICLMGSFEEVSPQKEAVDQLIQFLSWSAPQWDITASERVFHPASGNLLYGVSGHRDGCRTTCPGDQLYERMHAIRYAIDSSIVHCKGIHPPKDSTQSDTLQYALTLRPTYTSTAFTIELGDSIFRPLYVYLYDVNSRLIWRKRMKRTHKVFDISNLYAGIYFVKIRGRNIDRTIKLVKF